MVTYIIFILLGAISIKLIEIIFARKKPPDKETTGSQLPITQGLVHIDGKPTSVLILDGNTVNKTNTQPKTVAKFKPIPIKKFQLLE